MALSEYGSGQEWLTERRWPSTDRAHVDPRPGYADHRGFVISFTASLGLAVFTTFVLLVVAAVNVLG
jgi:hypothetical protein